MAVTNPSENAEFQSTLSARRPAGGFPLRALILFMAACSLFAAHLLPLAESIKEGNVSGVSAAVASLVAALVLMVIGALCGIMQRGPIAGFVVGAIAGLVLGALLGPLCLLPVEQFFRVFVVSIVGSVLLVVGAIFGRAR